jgi:hypothetical protein
MRRVFEAWMVDVAGLTENVAYQYALHINRISRHYTELTPTKPVDLYAPTKLATVKTIAKDCGQDGCFRDLGAKYNCAVRAAIDRYVDFLTYFESFLKGGPLPVYKKSEAAVAKKSQAKK